MKAIDWIKANWKWIAGIIILILIAVAVLTFKGCDKPNPNLQSIENTVVALQGTADAANLLADKAITAYDKIEALLGIRDSTIESLELQLKIKRQTVYVETPVLRTATDTIIKGVAYPEIIEMSGSVVVSRTDRDSVLTWVDRLAIKASIAGFEVDFADTDIQFKYEQLVAPNLEWYVRAGIALLFFVFGVAI